MATEIIPVPDLGGADKVEVIEVCVQVGDDIEAEQSLVVLESDKASMEIPCSQAGKVVSLKVKEGDTLSEGDALIELETAASSDAGQPENDAPETPEASEDAASEVSGDEGEPEQASASGEAEQSTIEVKVPDLGGADAVDVIELCVKEGDEVAEGDSLIVVESDKASMEIPSPAAGVVAEMKLSEGGKASEGDVILMMTTSASKPASAPEGPSSKPESKQQQAPAAATAAEKPQKPAAPAQSSTSAQSKTESQSGGDADVYAGPAVRKLARQLGVDLSKLKGSGPRQRLTKEDVRSFVKNLVAEVASGKLSSGTGIPAVPEIDFSQFGEVNVEKLSKIARVTSANMTRSWLNVPHVTQFDDADITELEAFRKSMKADAEKRGVKLTPLPFLLKAAAAALRAEPSFNVSLHADGEHIVRKQYVHIGVAVDTPNGLMVPVIRDVDKKGLWELAEESAIMAEKARSGKLKVSEMQGGCFTISSLGALGGTGFTPIVNTPEVAIMGVSKAQMKPVWNGSEFVPRMMLPLTVSYDHRAVNGADCGRFFTYLVSVLGDIRQLLL